jgi:hypothetical protein
MNHEGAFAERLEEIGHEGRRKKEEYFSCLFSESLTQSYGNYQFSIYL